MKLIELDQKKSKQTGNMKEREILKIFESTNALLSGHFLLTSGLHSDKYFQCAQVLQYPEIAEKLCTQIGHHFIDHKVDVVVAPAIGGIVVAHEVARFLKVRSLFAERENGKMALRRGFKIQNGENVVVVEDVITTGGSVNEVIELVKSSGGALAGVGCLVYRSAGKLKLEYPLCSLIELNIKSVPPENCVLCKQGLPLVKPGSRKLTDHG